MRRSDSNTNRYKHKSIDKYGILSRFDVGNEGMAALGGRDAETESVGGIG